MGQQVGNGYERTYAAMRRPCADGPRKRPGEALRRRVAAVSGPAVQAGMRHVPVLAREAVAALALTPDAICVDGTFGAGGYTSAMLDAAAGVRVIAIDRDPSAIAAGQALVTESGGRLTLMEGRFSELDELAVQAGVSALDAVVLDIGVSSMQIDEAQRGFSFRFDGPLDMRMGMAGSSAADLVNEADEAVLADVIYHYGEERRARAVARAIVAARTEAPITTTRQLVDLVSGVVHLPPGSVHPATRTFQALRIAVNDELGEIARALHAAERALRAGGRLAVVTFHSLEDRIVKLFLANRSGRGAGGSRHLPAQAVQAQTFRLVGPQPVVPSDAECATNPRARSAKLRVAERTEIPAQSPDLDVMALAALPEPARARPGRKPGGGRRP